MCVCGGGGGGGSPICICFKGGGEPAESVLLGNDITFSKR